MGFFQKNFFLLFVAAGTFFVNASFSQQSSSLGQASAVTVSEYTEFLNCIGAMDTYALYNDKMGDDEGIGALITRSGKPGSYTYSYNPDKASFPVTYISWFSAIRYCNWRSHHGATGFQDSSTTETGSYDLTAFDKGGDISTIVLAPGAKFFLPTNYLVDTTFQESSTQSCDPYLASSRLGFCFTIWNSNSSSADGAGGNSASLNQGAFGVNGSGGLSGVFPGSSSFFGSTARDATFSTPFSTGIRMLADASPDSNQFNMSLAVVGAPNNPPDVAPSGTNQVGYGSVLMPYQIGMYDVTAEQYCAFLNAVANKSDSHVLYNTNMTSDPDVACITRSGDATSGYTYTPISGREKFPITYVAWYSALRFCNWLENGQPTGGQPDVVTENGTYDIATINNGFRSNNIKLDETLSLIPQEGTAWCLPTEDQWYKAAYYIPSTNSKNKTVGKYAAFGTGSMDAPGNRWEEAVVANRANYALNGSFTATNQPRLTPVGSFSKSPSPWGLYDMAGEVNQWTSTFDKSTNNIIRGGCWKSQTSDELRSTFRLVDSSGGPSPTVGFRVVYKIPPAPVVTHLDMTNDLVAVRDANNPHDDLAATGGISLGSVPTEYQIEKYDVTAEQYCMFLNAVAAHADPHQLYRPEMQSDSNVACIIRYGNTNRGYSYFPWPGREKFPITYVNWFSAIRFCNWLENDQPIGDESPGITESGSFDRDDTGIFNISTNNPKWLIPTENQWYKAAYYIPGGNGDSGVYCAFGTGSYNIPNNSLLDNQTNAANYCFQGSFAMPTAPYLTPVGAFKKTTSPYGAYDMAGDVNQWTMTPLSADTTKLAVRGGSWKSTDFGDLRFSTAQFKNPNDASNVIGFRLVYNVPPPLPTWGQVGTKIYNNVTQTLYEDGKALATGSAATDPAVSGRFFGYITGPFIGELYQWSLSIVTLVFRNICLFLQKLLQLCLSDSTMDRLNGLFRGFFNFFFKSIGLSGDAAGVADYAELALWDSVTSPQGIYTMLSANPPLGLAILLGGILTYAAYEDLQQSDPRAGMSFVVFDARYILAVAPTVIKTVLSFFL
ncbi:MAG: formylglycine-generating enzyme family protein [Verrucomicrobia bacterium]|nr:formylglycine-generating enzyme family protein [Verrucomicrobiota bacterium]